MSINMELSEPIFLTSIGLIASGYDLYNRDRLDIVEIIDLIRREYVDVEVLNYFKSSRRETCAVNPYWPRGSALYAASLFLSSDYTYFNLDSYLFFEKKSNSSGLWEDDDFIKWIKQLPHYLRLIKYHPKTEEIIGVIKKCISKYEKEFEGELNEANKIMEDFYINRKCEVVYLPNLLQADQCTDYIRIENTLYVVASKPRLSSIVHEYLHLCMEPYGDLLAEYYKAYTGRNLFDTKKLAALGYLWDEGINAQLRCLEEGFVRGLTILISNINEEEKKKELDYLNNEGFLIADRLKDYLGVKVTEGRIKEIILRSLKN